MMLHDDVKRIMLMEGTLGLVPVKDWVLSLSAAYSDR